MIPFLSLLFSSGMSLKEEEGRFIPPKDTCIGLGKRIQMECKGWNEPVIHPCIAK